MKGAISGRRVLRFGVLWEVSVSVLAFRSTTDSHRGEEHLWKSRAQMVHGSKTHAGQAHVRVQP